MDFFVFSTKRSTHHAFIEGFLSSFNYRYYNNVSISNNGFRCAKELNCKTNKSFRHLNLYSFERNYTINSVIDSKLYQDIITRDKSTSIVYLRDPLNTLASSYSILKSNPNVHTDYVSRNMDQFKILLDFVVDEIASNKIKKFVFLYANKFWTDFHYRKYLELLLCADFTINPEISVFGGGGKSFFDTNSVDYDRLNKRYLNYLHDINYIKMLEKYGELINKFSSLVDEPWIVREYERAVCNNSRI